ncbi:hypothetical protein [Thiohalobacter thiocyanaticus]|uniref:hypothetical protein n=1 Tax=Thiohalobacter thiocyanaticus TaxID=585455 RepID=UPI001319D089|nr:hypothetical protein [Thiohalobacter thiocyanaticus]
MSPKRHTTSVSATAPARKHKGKVSSNALRQAVARRRLEERREAELLRQHLFDVFADE